MKKLTLYIDMDGVLADFDKAVFELTEMSPKDMEKKVLWDVINKQEEFFYNLDLMQGALLLMEKLKQYSPIILTACGNKTNSVMQEKIMWVNKHFKDTIVITVPHTYQKAFYAHQNAILIDDRNKAIDPWRSAGGIGVLHISAEETIKAIRKGFKTELNMGDMLACGNSASDI